jgi:chromosome segregation ATPase
MACEDDVLELMDQLAEKDAEIASLKEHGRELFEANEAMGERITELNMRINDLSWLARRLEYLHRKAALGLVIQ